MNSLFYLVLLALVSSALITTMTPIYSQDDDEKEEEEKEEEEEESEESEETKEEEEKEGEQSPATDQVTIVQNNATESGDLFTTAENTTQQQSETEPPQEEKPSELFAPFQQINNSLADISQTKQDLALQQQQILLNQQKFKEELKSIMLESGLTEKDCNCTLQVQPTKPSPPVQQQPILDLGEDHIVPKPTDLQQIIINPSEVIDYKSIGKVTNEEYLKTYNALNVLDNKPNDPFSFWSQYDRSGFLIQLKDDALKDWQVCSAEIDAYEPKSVPFTLAFQIGQNFTGILDSDTKKIDFEPCITDVNKILMYFDATDQYTSISELKLFGKRSTTLSELAPQVETTTTTTTQPPQLEQPITESKLLEIRDTNAEISIDNSTVILKFGKNIYKIDPSSKLVLVPNGINR